MRQTAFLILVAVVAIEYLDGYTLAKVVGGFLLVAMLPRLLRLGKGFLGRPRPAGRE